MTQLGEGIALGMVTVDKIECPFHEAAHSCSPDVENRREGDASKLGKNLDNGKERSSSTVLRTGAVPDDVFSSPQWSPDPELHYSEEKREVQIDAADPDRVYPTAFSAHHLIPAGAALAKADALNRFMNKGSSICCNLGYDVNGNENGVWLPGLHAVNGKGLKLWSGSVAPRELPDGEGKGSVPVTAVSRNELETAEGAAVTAYSYKPIDGPIPGDAGAATFYDKNMKWQYVQASMKYLGKVDHPDGLGERQFHDSHPSFSDLVLNRLVLVGDRLQALRGSPKDRSDAECPKCREASAKQPPPVALLGLLNGMSRGFRSRLTNGKLQGDQYFTSTWCGPR
jgi:hypothetical protein